jgi:DME family drug/metabolite transporter
LRTQIYSATASSRPHCHAVERRPAVLAVLAAAVLFGTTGTALSLGPDAATPLGAGTLRGLIGALTLWLIARSLPAWAELRRHAGPIVIGGAGVALYQPAFFTGVERAGVAVGTVVALASGPVFAAAIEAVVLRRRPSRTWALATSITVVGVALLVGGGGDGADVEALGVVAALGAGFGYAVYAVTSKSLIERGVESTRALAWSFSAGTLVLLPLLVVEPLDWLAEPGGVATVAYLGGVTVGVAYWLYGLGLRDVPTSTAVTLTLAEPVTAAVLAVLVLDERLDPIGWVGVGVVVVGLLLLSRAEDDEPDSVPPGAPRSASSGTPAATARRGSRRPGRPRSAPPMA